MTDPSAGEQGTPWSRSAVPDWRRSTGPDDDWRVVAAAARLGAAAVGVVSAVALVDAREWLGLRANLGLCAVGVCLVLLLVRPGSRAAAAAAAGLLVAGRLAVASELSRDATDSFAGRVLADDLPPLPAYVAAAGLAVAAVACGVVAALGPGGEPIVPRRRPAAACLHVVVGVALVAASLTVGMAGRSAADRRAEAAELTLVDDFGPAERIAEGPGPAVPAQRAWVRSTPVHAGESVAVPGWDVVLVTGSGPPFSLIAVSKTDGQRVWSYERHAASAVAVVVDPDAGRILLATGHAVVVLDLADGSELVTRRIPWECDAFRMPPGDGRLGVSPTATLGCIGEAGTDRMAVVDVSSGALLGSRRLPTGTAASEADGSQCGHAGAVATPVVVQTGSGPCLTPDVATFQPASGRFETLTSIEPPPPWSDLPGPQWSLASSPLVRPVAAGDLIVLQLEWMVDTFAPNTTTVPEDAQEVEEVVVLDRDGDLLWRRAGLDAVVAVTDRSVVARTPDDWVLLSRDDGAELARDPLAWNEHTPVVDGAPETAATDGERLYSITSGTDLPQAGVIVRDLANLSVRDVRADLMPIWHRVSRIHAADGLLFAQLVDVPPDGEEPYAASLVAYGVG